MKKLETAKKEKIANFLRLARKAGKISLGRSAVDRSINTRKAEIVFLGKKNNIGSQIKKSSNKKNGIKFSRIFSEVELAEIFGRRKLTIISVNDKNFTNGLCQILDDVSQVQPNGSKPVWD